MVAVVLLNSMRATGQRSVARNRVVDACSLLIGMNYTAGFSVKGVCPLLRVNSFFDRLSGNHTCLQPWTYTLVSLVARQKTSLALRALSV